MEGIRYFALEEDVTAETLMLLPTQELMKGGTVKRTVIKRQANDDSFEILPINCEPWGGKSIDKAFYIFLCEIFGPDIMNKLKETELDDYIDLFREFETRKRSIRVDQTSKVVISLPIALIESVKEKHRKLVETVIENCKYKACVSYSKQKLHVLPDTFRNLFKHSIDQIKKLLDHEWLSDINVILMVGGFVQCELVQNEVRKFIKAPKRLFVLEQPELVVLKGAVFYGHRSQRPRQGQDYSVTNAACKINLEYFLHEKLKKTDFDTISCLNHEDFQDLLSRGEFKSYENKVYLAGACNVGKTCLASNMIGGKIPKLWHSTDGLTIFFGRNGILINEKKMIPLSIGYSGTVSKFMVGEPDITEHTDETGGDATLQNNHTEVEKEVLNDCQDHSPQISTENTTEDVDENFLNHVDDVKIVRREERTPGEHTSYMQDEETAEHFSKIDVAPSIASSILQSLKEEIKSGKYKLEIAPSDLVDFGGQRSYDMTHQLFIQHKGTFVIMFDGRRGLYKWLPEYPDKGVTSATILVHWVNSILIYCGESDDVMPMIVFAATHSDYFKKDKLYEHKQCFEKEIRKLFATHEHRQHIVVDEIFFINSTDKNDPGIEALQNKLVEIAFKQTTWGEKRPIAWVPLELQLTDMRAAGTTIVTRRRLQEINKSNADLALNEKLFEHFLRNQHSLGKIMYFEQPGLDEYVIVQPTAMVNILRSFITDQRFWPDDIRLATILENLCITGSIRKKDLFDLWSQAVFLVILPDDNFKEYIVQVLLHLDILVEPKRYADSTARTDIFLVPCIVKGKDPMNIFKENKIEERSLAMAYVLKGTMVPTALSFKLIGSALNVWPLKQVKGRGLLYYQSATMCVDDKNDIHLSVRNKTVQVILTNKDSKHLISPDVTASIQECLTAALKRVLHFYHRCFGKFEQTINFSNLFDIKVGHIYNAQLCLSPLSGSKSSWICKNKQTHHQKYLLYWIFDKSNKECLVECQGLHMEALSLSPTDQHLARLANRIGILDFGQFIIYLGMEKIRWEGIQYQYDRNGELSKKLMALLEWKKEKAVTLSRPMFKDLNNALKELNFDHYLCQVYREDVSLFDKAELRLQEIPTDDLLIRLHKNIGNCVIELGIELCLSITDIEETLYDKRDMYSQLLDVLFKWKQQGIQSAVKPTVYRLMQALQRVKSGGLTFLAEEYNLYD